jgi:polar amino acid transport system substrate-binding protein
MFIDRINKIALYCVSSQAAKWGRSNMITRYFYALFVLLAALLAATAYAEHRPPEVTIYGDDNYPPVLSLDARGRPGGVLSIVLDHYQKKSGHRVYVHLVPWVQAYQHASNGQGGLIGLSKTPARMAIFDFSVPIYEDVINVVTRRNNSFPYRTLSDLNGKLIGVQLGASYGTEVDAAITGARFKTETSTTAQDRLKRLLLGKLDAVFIGNGALGLQRALLSDPYLAQHQAEFIALPTPLVRDRLYLGFRKDLHQQATLQTFDRIVKEMQATGIIPRITAP